MKLNKTREMLSEIFIKSLEEEKLPWSKGWQTVPGEDMHNPVSKTSYKGINELLLRCVSESNGYDDPRWCTFSQAKQKGWSIMKGAKGVPIEFWSIYDKENKKTLTITEYLDELKERDKEEFGFVSKTYTVFHASHINGIPEYEHKTVEKLNDIEMNTFVERIKNNLQVNYREHGNQAYYRQDKDIVVMPEKGRFLDQYRFDSTLLHELSHATGHPNRLNRDLQNTFGSYDYAKEELRAEISSAFLSSYLNMELSEEHLNEHKAYVQSWASVIKNNPNELFRAINDAEKISNYLIEIGGLHQILELREERMEVEKEIEDYFEKENIVDVDKDECIEYVMQEMQGLDNLSVEDKSTYIKHFAEQHFYKQMETTLG